MKTVKQRIAEHFGVEESDLEYRPDKGWYYQSHFLHKSLHEMQHCPGWSQKQIDSYYKFDR